MKDYEDEAFDELEKAQQRKVAHGVTDGSKKDAALRLAREVLKNAHSCTSQEYDKAIKAINEALEDV